MNTNITDIAKEDLTMTEEFMKEVVEKFKDKRTEKGSE